MQRVKYNTYTDPYLNNNCPYNKSFLQGKIAVYAIGKQCKSFWWSQSFPRNDFAKNIALQNRINFPTSPNYPIIVPHLHKVACTPKKQQEKKRYDDIFKHRH